MKKFLACLWVLALLIATSCCAVADEQETFINGYWTYRVLADGTAEITNCTDSDATSIQIPDTLDGRKVTDVDGYSFYYNKGSNNVRKFTDVDGYTLYYSNSICSAFIVSPDHPTLAVIDGVLFSKPDKRLISYPPAKAGGTYAIPQGIEIIGNYAFAKCDSLTSISIPNTVTDIGGRAFNNCCSLTSISIPDSVIRIEYSAFSDCSSLTSISIPNSVTSIGGMAFVDCISLTSISIPDTVTNIGVMTFVRCSSLTDIFIPDSVTNIGKQAFDDCPNLTLTVGRNSYAEQYAKENNIPYTLQDAKENNASYALPDDSDDWKYRILADGTAQITEYSNPNATSVQIPETLNGMKVTDVAENAFLLCLNNSSFVVSPDHPTLAVIDGVLFSKPDKRLISYPKAKEGDTYAIPQGIEMIGGFAFSYCTSLTSISIPNSVTSIGDNALARCSSLTSISIPNSVTSIGNEAFYNCSSLTSISIPDSVTSIGVGAFADCSSLTSISIPDGVTSIEYATFADCILLTSISIPNSVTSIDYWAFSNCSALTSLSIPDSVTSISDGAFNNCPNLTLTVGRNSYAEQYAKENNIPFAYSDANDWLTK